MKYHQFGFFVVNWKNEIPYRKHKKSATQLNINKPTSSPTRTLLIRYKILKQHKNLCALQTKLQFYYGNKISFYNLNSKHIVKGWVIKRLTHK